MNDKDKLQYEKLLPKFNARKLTKQEAVSFMRLSRIAEQEKFNESMGLATKQSPAAPTNAKESTS